MSGNAAPGIGLTSSITFTFTAGGRTVHEVNESCVNTLTLTQASATVLTFSEPQTAQCVAGTVTFTLHAATLEYLWANDVAKNTAILRKT